MQSAITANAKPALAIAASAILRNEVFIIQRPISTGERSACRFRRHEFWRPSHEFWTIASRKPYAGEGTDLVGREGRAEQAVEREIRCVLRAVARRVGCGSGTGLFFTPDGDAVDGLHHLRYPDWRERSKPEQIFHRA